MESITRLLQERQEAELLRALQPLENRKEGYISISGHNYHDFSSNDYLGLASHPAMKEAVIRVLKDWGTSSSASRLLSGDLSLHHQLEEKIAQFKDKEAALVFNSGYHANLGIISAICNKDWTIFADRLVHASLIDGALLSKARLHRFQHNDMNNLCELLEKERDKTKYSLIITETVFSMDGDKAPLKILVKLKEEYNCLCMVDEAHATGIFGRSGAGVVEEEGISARVDLIMGTFSKALGSFGAYVACSQEMKQYLINTARSFIYSTSLPPTVIAANSVSLDLVAKEPWRREELLANSTYVRAELVKKGYNVLGVSPIIPLIVGETKTAVSLSKQLQSYGYWVLPIRPPTVPEGKARLRISLTYHHTKDVLADFISNIDCNKIKE